MTAWRSEAWLCVCVGGGGGGVAVLGWCPGCLQIRSIQIHWFVIYKLY